MTAASSVDANEFLNYRFFIPKTYFASYVAPIYPKIILISISHNKLCEIGVLGLCWFKYKQLVAVLFAPSALAITQSIQNIQRFTLTPLQLKTHFAMTLNDTMSAGMSTKFIFLYHKIMQTKMNPHSNNFQFGCETYIRALTSRAEKRMSKCQKLLEWPHEAYS